MSTRQEWPTFALDYRFNPDGVGTPSSLEPDQVVVFDPDSRRDGWLAARRGYFVPLEHVQ